MKRLKLNERQILMLKNLETNQKSSKKTLKINEDQYNRLFNKNSKVKVRVNESDNKEINLTEFAEELIVFIKDVLSLPKPIPLSPYWEELGFTKSKLFNLLKKEGLLQLADEQSEIKEYITPKTGFRKKIREVYKKVKDNYNSINELDGGYPAGAENDPRAPYNQSDDDDYSDEREPLKADKKVMELIYYGEDDSLCIFKRKNELFVLLGGAFDNEVVEPYEEIPGNPEPEAYSNFVNDKLVKGEMKVYKDKNAFGRGDLALITPEIKEDILKWYGDDEELKNILNQLPESTGAASSGAYVGGSSFGTPIRKNTGESPEESMKDLSEVVDANGVAQYHSDINGEERFTIDNIDWEYVNVVDDSGKIDLGVYRHGQDIAYSYDWFAKNILNNTSESTTTVSVGGDSGTFAYDAPVGTSDFWTAGNKQNKTKRK